MNTGLRPATHDYAELLRMIVDKPGTAADLARLFGRTERRVRQMLAGMCDMGLIVVCAWRGPVPVWSTQGPPAPCPHRERTGLRRPQNRALVTFCVLVRALWAEPSSVDQLASATGVYRGTVRRVVARLLQLGLVFIKTWGRHLNAGGEPPAMYQFGIDRRNRERPQPKTPADRDRRHKHMRRMRSQHAQLLFMTAGRAFPPGATTDPTN